ncbi:DIO3 [Branchiostoma lanceolatum]|uniref:Iodothyronine deiodinase n=1 Tax=Branchiostoma lanceolatum TaxID=7740 RepID=A0A8J9VCE2_BRALA|nr:DIO3 [Branchiostoma lanceolatum]
MGCGNHSSLSPQTVERPMANMLCDAIRPLKVLAAPVVFIVLCFAFALLKAVSVLLTCVAPAKKQDLLAKLLSREESEEADHSQYDIDEFLTWSSLKGLVYSQMVGLMKKARQGGPAPDPTLVLLDSVTEKKLLSFAVADRPLFVNFGSYT